MTSTSAPSAAAKGSAAPVVHGATEAGTTGSWTLTCIPRRCASSASDGEFLVEWVFSL